MKRIGALVFLFPADENVVPEGFKRTDGYYLKKKTASFCFRIRHLKGRVVNQCVEEMPDGKPSVSVRISKHKVDIRLEGYNHYRVYPFKDKLIPREIMELKDNDKITLKRGKTDSQIAITGVVKNIETDPVIITIPKKEVKPARPHGLKIFTKGGFVVLVWDYKGRASFIIRKNGKIITEDPIEVKVFVEKAPAEETVYEVIAVENGVKSQPSSIIYKP